MPHSGVGGFCPRLGGGCHGTAQDLSAKRRPAHRLRAGAAGAGHGLPGGAVVLPGRRGHGHVPADFSGVHGIRLAGHGGHQCSLGPAGGTKPCPGAGHGGYPAGALRYSPAVWLLRHAAASAAGRACRPVSPPRYPRHFGFADLSPQPALYGGGRGGARLLFGGTPGTPECHCSADRTDHPHGNRHRRTACAGPMGGRLRLCRRSTGQHGQRGHLLRPHVRLCRQNAGVCPPRR